MNSNTLSLLGCSGSLAIVLLVGNVANADTLTSPVAAVAVPPATQNTEVVVPVISEIPVHVSPRVAAINPDSDTVGDLAIARFHCDCPACRVAILQMLQTGQLSL